ncbi:GNAT family N-acetyltransferase [Streptomyces showdoensis]|uniref:GNAT family N-acetyltransferase n=1 Tax=Streptomyces showdoensis TaxID=68268 RepID=UPI001F0AC311|nr:GNAT family N-acetyltransferase [Streptomyces showdoensis]
MATGADGSVIGVAAGGVPLPGEGEIYALAVVPGARRRGVGRALLTAAGERMLCFGATEQRVTLPSERDPSLPFFERLGFRPLGPTRLNRAL